MRSMCSAQRQVELRRHGDQLSLCEVGNILLHRDMINDSETVYFVIQDHHFDRDM